MEFAFDPFSRWSVERFPLLVRGRTAGGRRVERSGLFPFAEACDAARTFARFHGMGQTSEVLEIPAGVGEKERILFSVNTLGEKTFAMPTAPTPEPYTGEIPDDPMLRAAFEVFPGAIVMKVRRP